jgi:hypothetical protein
MSASGSNPPLIAPSLEYTPSEDDLAAVRSSFLEFLPLPLELVDPILDYAEYWPSLNASRNINTVVRNDGTCCYIVTPPFPAPGDDVVSVPTYNNPDGSAARTPDTDKPMPILHRSIRRIRIKTLSHDQGWGGEWGDRGTYNGSWTWFEAVIIDPSIASSLERYISNPSTIPNSDTDTDTDTDSGPGSDSDSRDLSHAKPFLLSPDDFSMIKSAGSPKRTKRSHSPPRHWHIQSNVTSRSTWKDHTIIWDAHDDLDVDVDENSNATANRSTDNNDGNQNNTKVDQWKNYSEWKGRMNMGHEVVQLLKPGDRLAVIARAQFPGWENHVSAVSVEVFYFGW